LYLVIQDQKLGTAQIRKKLAYYAGFENIFKCEKNDKKNKNKTGFHLHKLPTN